MDASFIQWNMWQVWRVECGHQPLDSLHSAPCTVSSRGGAHESIICDRLSVEEEIVIRTGSLLLCLFFPHQYRRRRGCCLIMVTFVRTAATRDVRQHVSNGCRWLWRSLFLKETVFHCSWPGPYPSGLKCVRFAFFFVHSVFRCSFHES